MKRELIVLAIAGSVFVFGAGAVVGSLLTRRAVDPAAMDDAVHEAESVRERAEEETREELEAVPARALVDTLPEPAVGSIDGIKSRAVDELLELLGEGRGGQENR